MDKLEGILGRDFDDREKNEFERLRENTIEALMNYRNILEEKKEMLERRGKGKYIHQVNELDEYIHRVDRLIEIIEGLKPTPKNQEYLREVLRKMENALGLLKYLDLTKKPGKEQYSRGIRGYLRRIGGGIYRKLRGIGRAVYEGLGDLYYKLRKGFEKIGYRIDDFYKGLKHYFGRLKEWIGKHKSIVARAIMYSLLIPAAMADPFFKALLALILMVDVPLMMLELEVKLTEKIKKHM